jgi:hypothetical protein
MASGGFDFFVIPHSCWSRVRAQFGVLLHFQVYCYRGSENCYVAILFASSVVVSRSQDSPVRTKVGLTK